MSPTIQTDQELARKAFMNKVKKVAVVGVVIVIVAIAASILLNQGGLSFKIESWQDNRPQYGSFWVHLNGTIYSSMTKTATNVKLVVRLYDSQNTLLTTETVDVDNIPAGGSRKITIDIPHSGFAEKCETELQWKTAG